MILGKVGAVLYFAVPLNFAVPLKGMKRSVLSIVVVVVFVFVRVGTIAITIITV